ncbi:MAG: glycosyltransferase family 39 protein [Candidatus Bathyarchaeia archaeon]
MRLLKSSCNFRLAFFIFAICYLSILIGFLILNLSNMPIQWDEAAHLDNGLFLKLGMFKQFSGNLFYPPLYDALTFLSYNIFGVSVVSARMVDAVFSVLLLWVVFEFTYKVYNGKTALLGSIFLSLMPGYFEASHMAMLDIMVTFFFVLSIFFFYLWLQTHKDRMLIFTGLTLILGFLAKYQIVVAMLVMLFAIVIFSKSQLKRPFSRKLYIAIISVLLAIAAYLIYSLQSYLGMWLNAIGMTTTGSQTITPVYYLIEMNSLYSTIHPISLLMYILGFLGLGIFAIRRQNPDKLLLTWFITVYVFYTLVNNKNWRYVLPLFPVLAIAAAVFVTYTYTELRSLNRKTLTKIGASILIALTCLSMFYSVNDTIYWTNSDKAPFELEQAVEYTIAHDSTNQSIMVLIPDNYFSEGIIEFYLLKDGGPKIQVYNYPWSRIIDPSFNITVLISRCKEYNVKFLFTTEFGGNNLDYFNSTVTLMDIYAQLYSSNNFTHVTPEQTFGKPPLSIYILNYTG